MGLIRDCTKYKPDYAVISYIDASFWDSVKEFTVKFEPAIYEHAKARATNIMTSESAEDLQPEGWIAGGKECDYCPFVDPCGVARRDLPSQKYKQQDLDPQLVEEITQLCRTAKLIEDHQKSIKGDVRAAHQQIKDRLREKGIRAIAGVVSWTNVRGRSSYDQKALREAAAAAGLDVEAFSTAGEPTDRLTIFVRNSDREPEEDLS
jgi:hypothetical protein